MTTTSAAAERPMEVDDLLKLERLADPQVSPDGRSVVYSVTRANLEENKTSSTLWLVPSDGGPARQLTTAEAKDQHPRFSPDGRQIVFESNRSGSTQLWLIAVDGGEARQLTHLASEAAGGVWSPDGKWIAFVSAVWPEHSTRPFDEADAAHKARADEAEKNPVKARVFDRLFFRHWDSWVEGKRQHLLLVSVEGGSPRNLTPGDADAFPTSSTFSVGDDFTFSPDGRYVYFTAPPRANEAWSTNYDLWRVAVAGGAPENLTADNPAADGCPRFSPDGKWLAYRAQRQPGFEADRWELMIRPAGGGAARSLTADVDLSIDQFVWGADGKTLYFLAEQQATVALFRTSLEASQPVRLTDGPALGSLSISRDAKVLAALESSLRFPPRVVAIDPQGAIRPLTHANEALLAQLELPEPESVTIEGAEGAPMQMWIVKPPGFSPDKKWPLVYLVHGGPQGAWTDSWSYRWNPQVWAARGYVVALPNPRGSTGFGQQYVNEISGDWGGRCFQDLMAGVAWLEKQPYIDRSRLAAAGASFGGYMMNWFGTQTDKFTTLITHCGVYNFESMYATTEELWFDEWEHGGPPWEDRRASYEKHSPHRFVKNYKTPTLIIHNDQDFRVPVSEGLQLFTALQRLGVDSRFVNFPDEGHWVLKPANSRFWHHEIFTWLAKYCPPGGR